MTSEEKKEALIAKIGEDKVREFTQNIWLLIGALNTAKYAIAQFEPEKLKFGMKRRFLDLRTSINLFVNNFERTTSKEEREYLAEMSYENVGAIAELMSMIMLLPPSQIEWYIEECKKMTFVAINRESLK